MNTTRVAIYSTVVFIESGSNIYIKVVLCLTDSAAHRHEREV